MKVLGLHGHAGVGKNTLADLYLKPLGYRDLALADDIKIRAVATGVATYEEVYGPHKPDHVRTWLQLEGTERGREVFGEDVWVSSLFARMRRINECWGLDRFVVTDVRFPNEVAYIREKGGVVLSIHAPERYVGNGMSPEQRGHDSEAEVRKVLPRNVDGVLLNDPDMQNTLKAQVTRLLFSTVLETPDGLYPQNDQDMVTQWDTLFRARSVGGG
jgi:dephospho-CoA kinase